MASRCFLLNSLSADCRELLLEVVKNNHSLNQTTRRMDVDDSSLNEFEWTTGEDPALSHQRAIASGAYGDVHEVLPHLTVTYYYSFAICRRERNIPPTP